MELLVLGVALWSLVHLFPAALPDARRRAVAAVGAGPYRGLFALTILGAMLLIVLGWRTTPVVTVYAPPSWGRLAANALMLVASFLFVASGTRTNVKRLVRHPQLLGLAGWASAHLLANGESRSLVLFGGLGVWSIVMIAFLNRRDGERQEPEPSPIGRDLLLALIALAVFALLLWLHPIVIGVSARAL